MAKLKEKGRQSFIRPKTRKETRKEQRKMKKQRRLEYYTNRRKPGKFVLKPPEDKVVQSKPIINKENQQSKKMEKKISAVANQSLDVMVANEKRKLQKLEKEMQKQRNKQLREANIQEDRNIKWLEKQLKLNKRKSKSIPKSFMEDGLDYLLEVCDPENMKSIVAAEQQLHDVTGQFDEDFDLMTDGKKNRASENDIPDNKISDDIVSGETKSSKGVLNGKRKSTEPDSPQKKRKTLPDDDLSELETESSINSNNESCSDTDEETSKKSHIWQDNRRKESGESKSSKKKQKELLDDNLTDSEMESEHSIDGSDKDDNDDDDEECEKTDTWEDIYGRTRGKDGSIITNNTGKYVPPAIRARMEEGQFSTDKARIEKLNRLKKQLKGHLNRLALANMHSIARQIEELYMNNSRNDMNDSITTLILESLTPIVNTPERLLMEHVLLITILHANIGTEVGAHFLQTVVKQFDSLFNSAQEVENKTLDNTVNIIAQLYNFRVFHSQLLYQLLSKLSGKFDEKCVECILGILRTVGFSLRKDDPLALKSLIIDLQKQASNVPKEVNDNSRIKYMLDILLAIKNNNMYKIPNYDTSYSEHLKKLQKNFIRKGNYVTPLNISLDDLLQAEERGKWWIVGSAWTGTKEEENTDNNQVIKTEAYSEKLLKIARKQRMNTDTRRNIFCILASAEDYLDAFGKLLHLGLKKQEEREILNIIVHCCLVEKKFNPFYAVLAQKFCETDRNYKMNLKCAVWDKLRTLTECSALQVSNLASLLTHLFLEKGLPISMLKVIKFSDIDKVTMQFVREVLLGILLCKDTESCTGVFDKIVLCDKLKVFRESLRLFILMFVLRKSSKDPIPENQTALLETRAAIVTKMLTTSDRRTKF